MKYILAEGYVISKTDGDRHFISCEKLRQLYRLRRGEYVYWRYGERIRDYSLYKKCKVLGPRDDGDYSLPRDLALKSSNLKIQH